MSVVVAGLPDGVTVAGEKVQVAREGNPEQAKETAEVKPFSGATLMKAEALCPELTETTEAEAESEKSGGGRLMVYVAVAMGLAASPAATAMASTVPLDDRVKGPVYSVEPAVGVVPS
ncbi:MAG: hypothetical protein WB622_06090, partial [Acidobacteriaceae bacterium]